MMDLLLEAWVSGLIELNKFEWMLGAGNAWKPGEKLKLLFAGYNGTRNTGSDVRVEEMIRQVRRILGAENVALSVMTQNFDLHARIFRRRAAGAPARCVPAVSAFRSAQKPRRGGLRRLDVQEQIRKRADDHDDRRAGHRRRRRTN